jgi:hypothetical protein
VSVSPDPAFPLHPDRYPEALRDHLVDSRLAGRVDTSPAESLANCRKLLAGNPEYTFGMSDWRDAELDEVVDAVASLCGEPAVASPHGGPGWIDPDASIDAIATHRARLEEVARRRGRVLLVTGHPTGLLPHYQGIARTLADVGCAILTPRDDGRFLLGERPARLRYLDGVATVMEGADLVHTHRSDPAGFILDTLEGRGDLPDLVLGDHGLAGAAIERGIPTLSIADVNDPALPLAQARGRTDAVLPIDDNLRPALFEPVTRTMLAGLAAAGRSSPTRTA